MVNHDGEAVASSETLKPVPLEVVVLAPVPLAVVVLAPVPLAVDVFGC